MVGEGHFLPALKDDDAGTQKGSDFGKDDIVICPDGTLLIPIKPVVQPVKIINELKGKELCIHNKMENTKNNYIAGVMSNFKGNSVFDIKIVSVPTLSDNENGKTTHVSNSKTILIQINSSKANGKPGLSLAKTILHEYIHARMVSMLGTKLVPTAPDAVKFRNTYDSYEKTEFEPTPAHQTMADLYVNSMAEGLASFHKNELKEDYNKYKSAFGEFPSFDFYKALAWEGLSNQGVTAWTNLPESERKKFTTLQARTGMLTNLCN
ncbi:hypothetical protein U1E44_00515 [Arenibacter sp. GZD96]|uniref:hypothetical protein n=1 Tax=Aurantibrevibacter litoralis TaxID=3106030 RepID=UPI002AFEA370|nr:hypothetical protein [Arenibacter sp. GZD-96]MEA1784561.1 hypothetical protein [Arenibacter sp. GZD-96]